MLQLQRLIAAAGESEAIELKRATGEPNPAGRTPALALENDRRGKGCATPTVGPRSPLARRAATTTKGAAR